MADYPVCCIVEVPITALNNLLDQARAGSEELVPGSAHELSIVLTTTDGSSRLPDHATIPPLNDGFKPFVASSLEDAAKVVGGAAYFAVLDRQSTTDESAVLVHRQGDGSLATARATFKSVQLLLVSLSMATLGFQEIKSIADSQGGVYGRSPEAPRKGGPTPRMRLGGN
ncbi:hypothetical protein SAMD00023353_0102660 [Rosellinia necatrix]|uniref:Uncharacterized protein n=1 Tax=Rosellinia necatrix TaxID=77044 RepID=A0A1S7UHT0_ROSNE|nr:hypothetical protein SAMD00023353_0102660 [Rosellinia necatrix]